MKEKLDSILLNAKEEILKANNEVEMNVVKSKFMGKSSEFTEIMKSIGSLSPEEKKSVGVLRE